MGAGASRLSFDAKKSNAKNSLDANHNSKISEEARENHGKNDVKNPPITKDDPRDRHVNLVTIPTNFNAVEYDDDDNSILSYADYSDPEDNKVLVKSSAFAEQSNLNMVAEHDEDYLEVENLETSKPYIDFTPSNSNSLNSSHIQKQLKECNSNSAMYESSTFLTSIDDFSEKRSPVGINLCEPVRVEDELSYNMKISSNMRNMISPKEANHNHHITSPKSLSSNGNFVKAINTPTDRNHIKNILHFSNSNLLLERSDSSESNSDRLSNIHKTKIWTYAENARLEKEVEILQSQLAKLEAIEKMEFSNIKMKTTDMEKRKNLTPEALSYKNDNESTVLDTQRYRPGRTLQQRRNSSDKTSLLIQNQAKSNGSVISLNFTDCTNSPQASSLDNALDKDEVVADITPSPKTILPSVRQHYMEDKSTLEEGGVQTTRRRRRSMEGQTRPPTFIENSDPSKESGKNKNVDQKSKNFLLPKVHNCQNSGRSDNGDSSRSSSRRILQTANVEIKANIPLPKHNADDSLGKAQFSSPREQENQINITTDNDVHESPRDKSAKIKNTNPSNHKGKSRRYSLSNRGINTNNEQGKNENVNTNAVNKSKYDEMKTETKKEDRHDSKPPLRKRHAHNRVHKVVKVEDSEVDDCKFDDVWTNEIDTRWMEVSLLLRKPIESEEDVLFTIASAEAGLMCIDQLDHVSKSVNVLRGTLSRWLLPYDNNTRIDDQCSTPHTVTENMPDIMKGKINDRQIHYLVSGINSIRQLVRIKIADDNDLEQAKSALKTTINFFKALQDNISSSSTYEMTVFQTIESKGK